MATLQESKIEDFAFEHLHSFYYNRYKTRNLRLAKNQHHWLGGKADGLLSYKDSGDDIFVATINTNVSSELSFLLTRHKKRGLSKWRLLTFLILLVGTAFLCKEMRLGLLGIGLTPIIAFAGFIVHSLLERKYLFHRISKLMAEVSATPANERWLGLSISSLTFRCNSLARHLQNICRQQGIGLITVGKRFKLVLMHEPKHITCVKGDFLSYYHEEETIRTLLQDESVLRVA